MFTLLRDLYRRRALRSGVRRAISSGVGFYETSFSLATLSRETLVREIIAWCREAIACTDRPYGVDHLTLALALEAPHGSRRASVTLPALRPADFYDGGCAFEDIAAGLDWWDTSALTAGPNAGRLHVVLFSWGDLTRELLAAG